MNKKGEFLERKNHNDSSPRYESLYALSFKKPISPQKQTESFTDSIVMHSTKKRVSRSPNEPSVEVRNLIWAKQQEERRTRMKELQDRLKLTECSFQPKIDKSQTSFECLDNCVTDSSFSNFHKEGIRDHLFRAKRSTSFKHLMDERAGLITKPAPFKF